MNLLKPPFLLLIMVSVFQKTTSFEDDDKCDNVEAITPFLKNLEKLKVKQNLKEHAGFLEALTHFKKSGIPFLASGSFNDKTIKIWNLTDSSNQAQVTKTYKTPHSIMSLTAFNKNGEQYLASGGYGSNVTQVTNLQNTIQYTLSGHSGYVGALINYKSNNGTIYLVTGSNDNTIKLWDIQKRTCFHTFEGCNRTSIMQSCKGKGHSSTVSSLDTFIENNKTYMVSGSLDNVIKVWDLDSKSLKTTLTGHVKSVKAIHVFYQNDTPYVASASDDSTIKIWNLHTFKLIKTLMGHVSKVKSLTVVLLEKNKLCLVSASDDQTIQFWDLNHYVLIQTLQAPFKPRSLTTFIQNNQIHVVSGHNGNILIWSDDEEPNIDQEL